MVESECKMMYDLITVLFLDRPLIFLKTKEISYNKVCMLLYLSRNKLFFVHNYQ